MNLTSLDVIIILSYLLTTIIAGILLGRSQKSSFDYFLGGKKLRWPAVGLSMVASETSALTFISIPGLAYSTDCRFLQVVIGYCIGRIIVAFVFLPAYFRGDLVTAYEFLGNRFGIGLRRLSSVVFLVTRTLGSAVRLYATAIPLHLVTGLDYITSIMIIGSCTLLYTFTGGLRAVVIMDVVQLFIYLIGAVIVCVIIFQHLPNGWSDVMNYAVMNDTNKFAVFHWRDGNSLLGYFTSPYTLIGGVLGGTFLSMASHGVDQLLVQRLLGCRSLRDSQKALFLDASMIIVQFAFFLFLGILIFVYNKYFGISDMSMTTDEIFPRFIISVLPAGIAGIVIAGMFASAMGSLSSTLSALASSTFHDQLGSIIDYSKNKLQELRWSRFFTFVWGVILIGTAICFTGTTKPVIEIGLKIASFTFGGLLGMFFLGLFLKNICQRSAFVGFCCGIAVMAWVVLETQIAFTWHTFIGCSVSFVTAFVAEIISRRIRSENPK